MIIWLLRHIWNSFIFLSFGSRKKRQCCIIFRVPTEIECCKIIKEKAILHTLCQPIGVILYSLHDVQIKISLSWKVEYWEYFQLQRFNALVFEEYPSNNLRPWKNWRGVFDKIQASRIWDSKGRLQFIIIIFQIIAFRQKSTNNSFSGIRLKLWTVRLPLCCHFFT